MSFHDQQPVKKCVACKTADCAWCVGSNKARLAFPRATRAPEHDAAPDDEHHCHACFMKLPNLVVRECNPNPDEP